MDFTEKLVLRWSDRKIEKHFTTTAVPIITYSTSHTEQSHISRDSLMNSANSLFYSNVHVLSLLSLIVITYEVIY